MIDGVGEKLRSIAAEKAVYDAGSWWNTARSPQSSVPPKRLA